MSTLKKEKCYMKKIRKMITVYKSIWADYQKALKKKGEAMGDPKISVSSDLSRYMKEEAARWG